jgi:transcriptional regulator with XRE-family HTH domain
VLQLSRFERLAPVTDRDALYRHVGGRIRAARGKELSQDALALAVGLTRSSISNIEKGRQKLLLHTLVDIANALKVEAATLLPPRPSETTLDEPGQLAQLPEKERAFIESAIGITPINKRSHGRQTKANPRTRRGVAR